MAVKIFSLGFLSVGVIILMQVILPIVSFQLWEITLRNNNLTLIAPTPSNSPNILGVSIENDLNFSYFVSNTIREFKPNYNEFSISVPRLHLRSIPVLVDSNNLSVKLAHLPGSGLPGEKGNVFISGHSATNPLFGIKEAYFSKLTEVKIGDEIIAEVNAVQFKYRVEEIKVVSPTDVSVIAPIDTSGRYISLMTCVPPGLNFKRLVVLGKMI